MKLLAGKSYIPKPYTSGQVPPVFCSCSKFELEPWSDLVKAIPEEA